MQMGGVDAIAFTAGLGENDTNLRHQILEKMEECLGLSINYELNDKTRRKEVCISNPGKQSSGLYRTDQRRTRHCPRHCSSVRVISMFEGLYSALEQSEVITLYRHINPDCDALGSQWGLATWLKHRFPLKRVIVLGHQKMTNGLFPDSDEIDDETIRQSLAIVLDTANVRRIDDDRWQSAGRSSI